jgi:hypothetical protein
LLAQGGDLHVSLGDHLGDPAEGLVGRGRAVSPERGGRAQQCDVGRSQQVVGVEWRIVTGELRHLATTADGDGNHTDQDHQGRQDQQDRHSKNRRMLVGVLVPG